jgi:ATP-dependent RNA helicase RhlE
VVVATDIAARGIDVKDLPHVVNFDMPNEPESYVHRVGRTGRARAAGTALSFCSRDERSFLSAIERLTRTPLERLELPAELASAAIPAAADGGRQPEERRQRARGPRRGRPRARAHRSRHA